MSEPSFAVRAIGLVAVAGVAVGLAGCGTARVSAGAHRPPVVSHSTRVVVAERIAHPAAWAKSQALTLARRILARQAIPAGARLLRAGHHLPWALQLAENINDPGYSVRVSHVYLVPMPESAVIGFLRSHFPGATADNSFGTGGSEPEQYVTYRQTAVPDGVTGTLFFAGVLSAGPSRTWLRLDSMVDWCLPRTPAEHIDAAKYRAVVVTGFDVKSRRTTTRTFTAPSVIAKLARLLNAMPTTGSDYYCPLFAGGDQLTFEPKPGQAPVVTVREGPCSILAITVGGKNQPTVGFGYKLTSFADRLVGIG